MNKLKQTIKTLVLALAAFVCVSSLRADWTLDASSSPATITDSEQGWVLNVTVNGTELTLNKACTQQMPDGDGVTLDLSASVTDGENNAYSIVELAESAFDTDFTPLKSNKSKIKVVKLPNTLRKMNDFSFYQNYGLTTVVPFLPASVDTIGKKIFYNCTKLTGMLVFGKKKTDGESAGTFTFAGEAAFGNTAIKEIIFYADVSYFPNNLFAGCSQLKRVKCFGAFGTSNSGNQFSNTPLLTDVWFSPKPVNDYIIKEFNGFKRMFVLKTNSSWKTFMENETYVTKWENLSDEKRKEYTDEFSYPTPYGLTTDVAGGSKYPFPGKWVLTWPYSVGFSIVIR